MSVVSMQRWKKLSCTTNSGRVVFTCLSCGRTTDGPTDKCPDETMFKREVPCHLWPMTDDAYQSLGKSSGFIFHGTVIAPDGRMSNVSVELEPAIVKEFFIVTAEQEFKLDPDDAQMVGSMTAVERRRHHQKEGLIAGEEIDRNKKRNEMLGQQQQAQGQPRGIPTNSDMSLSGLGGFGGADGSRSTAERMRRETQYGPIGGKAKGS